MLREAHDLSRARPAGTSASETRPAFSACSTPGSTGQPCGQRSGRPRRTLIRSIMSSVNVSPISSACTCDSDGRVAHEVGEEPLDDAVLADDPLGALDPGGREDRLLLLASLDEPVDLEPLQHLARPRRARRRASPPRVTRSRWSRSRGGTRRSERRGSRSSPGTRRRNGPARAPWRFAPLGAALRPL